MNDRSSLLQGILEYDKAIITSDLGRLSDLRLFLKSCHLRLETMRKNPEGYGQEMEREKVYLESARKEISRLEQRLAMRGIETP